MTSSENNAKSSVIARRIIQGLIMVSDEGADPMTLEVGPLPHEGTKLPHSVQWVGFPVASNSLYALSVHLRLQAIHARPIVGVADIVSAWRIRIQEPVHGRVLMSRHCTQCNGDNHASLDVYMRFYVPAATYIIDLVIEFDPERSTITGGDVRHLVTIHQSQRLSVVPILPHAGCVRVRQETGVVAAAGAGQGIISASDRSAVHDLVERVFVLNCDAAPERWLCLQAGLHAAFGLCAERISVRDTQPTVLLQTIAGLVRAQEKVLVIDDTVVWAHIDLETLVQACAHACIEQRLCLALLGPHGAQTVAFLLVPCKTNTHAQEQLLSELALPLSGSGPHVSAAKILAPHAVDTGIQEAAFGNTPTSPVDRSSDNHVQLVTTRGLTTVVVGSRTRAMVVDIVLAIDDASVPHVLTVLDHQIRSIMAQSYPYWRLFLVRQALLSSVSNAVRRQVNDQLQRWVVLDDRICAREVAGVASLEALLMATTTARVPMNGGDGAAYWLWTSAGCLYKPHFLGTMLFPLIYQTHVMTLTKKQPSATWFQRSTPLTVDQFIAQAATGPNRHCTQHHNLAVSTALLPLLKKQTTTGSSKPMILHVDQLASSALGEMLKQNLGLQNQADQMYVHVNAR